MLGLTFVLATGLSLRAPPPRMASARPDATVLFVVPGALTVLGLSIIYVTYQHAVAVSSIFFGVKAAVLAL